MFYQLNTRFSAHFSGIIHNQPDAEKFHSQMYECNELMCEYEKPDFKLLGLLLHYHQYQ